MQKERNVHFLSIKERKLFSIFILRMIHLVVQKKLVIFVIILELWQIKRLLFYDLNVHFLSIKERKLFSIFILRMIHLVVQKKLVIFVIILELWQIKRLLF